MPESDNKGSTYARFMRGLKLNDKRQSPTSVVEHPNVEKDPLSDKVKSNLSQVQQQFQKGEACLIVAEAFNFSDQQSTGGVTGSMRLALNKVDPDEKTQYFQYKTTITQAETKRKIKAQWLDRENFGEVIASKISMAMLNSQNDKNNAPSVHLVYDQNSKSVNVASRYLSNVLGTLDDYLANSSALQKPEQKHVAIVTELDDRKHLPGFISIDHPDVAPLKTSLANAIVGSALVGDHDVNPGNIMVVKDGGSSVKAVRIDFGHALDDLLNAPSMSGGTLINVAHPVIDFLNREHVAGFPKPAPSKLWRDYPGIVLTEEFHQALCNMSQGAEQKIQEGVRQAICEYEALAQVLMEKQDVASMEHVMTSLEAMHKNFTNLHIKPPKLRAPGHKDYEKNLDVMRSYIYQTLGNVGDRCTANAHDMGYAADLLQYQLAVDDYIQAEAGGRVSNHDLVDKYQQLMQLKDDLHLSGQITWIKTDKEQLALECDPVQYIQQRQRFLKPKLETQKLKEDQRYDAQQLYDTRITLERKLLDKGMDHIDIISISHTTESDENFPEIDELKALQEVFRATPIPQECVQWQPSQIGTEKGVKTLNAYKGTADDYLYQRRNELHIMDNMTDTIEFESIMEDVAQLYKTGEVNEAQSKLKIHVSNYLEEHSEKALQMILSELPEEQVELYQTLEKMDSFTPKV